MWRSVLHLQLGSGGLPVIVLARASPHLCRACLLLLEACCESELLSIKLFCLLCHREIESVPVCCQNQNFPKIISPARETTLWLTVVRYVCSFSLPPLVALTRLTLSLTLLFLLQSFLTRRDHDAVMVCEMN